jgi:hypothetical protein
MFDMPAVGNGSGHRPSSEDARIHFEYDLQHDSALAISPKAIDSRVRMEARNSQAIDTGIERFIWNFAEEPVAHTVVVQPCFHQQHAWAVYLEHGERRMILNGEILSRAENDDPLYHLTQAAYLTKAHPGHCLSTGCILG